MSQKEDNTHDSDDDIDEIINRLDCVINHLQITLDCDDYYENEMQYYDQTRSLWIVLKNLQAVKLSYELRRDHGNDYDDHDDYPDDVLRMLVLHSPRDDILRDL